MAFLNHWLLSILLLVPAVGAIVVLFVRPPLAMRWTAMATTLAAFCLSLLLMVPFKWQATGNYGYGANGTVQLLCQCEWLPAIHSSYKVALDGISFLMVVLTTIICAAACAASFSISVRPRRYFSLLLFFEATTLGGFVAFDLLLLYGFLILSIIPAFLLIGRWGQDGARRAATRFLMYMLAGMACLFLAFWGAHMASRAAFPGGTFDLIALTSRHIPAMGRVMFLLVIVGFLMRLPVLPLNGWLTDVFSEAPGPIAAFVGALIPLTGGYGLIRIAWPLFAHEAMSLSWLIIVLGVVSILIAGLRAIAEQDLKRSIAYASTAMIGFVLLGVAVLTPAGLNGAALALLGHGFIAAMAMFLLNGVPARFNGLVATAPIRGVFFVIACLAVVTVPGLLSEGIVILGIFQAARPDSLLQANQFASPGALYVLAIAASLGVVLIGVWAALIIRQAFSAPIDAEPVADLTGRDSSYLAPLAAMTVLLGLFPLPLCFTFTQRTVEAILKLLG